VAQTVAVIGASNDRRKFGNRAVRAFQARGDRVIPINPRQHQVEGLRAYRSVLDVPEAIDVATIYVPPDVGIRVLAELKEKQIREIWINPGAESEDLLAEAARLNVPVIVACSIMAVGQNPYTL
jgi:acyl-CoA synthetase (NDP forming)